MQLLCLLFGLDLLKKQSSFCYVSGYFSNVQNASILVKEAYRQVHNDLRPQILNIVEAIGVPDVLITSAIGNSYGDIYETHLRWA